MFEPDKLAAAAAISIAAEGLPEGHKNAIVATGSTEGGGTISLVCVVKPNDHWEFDSVLGYSRDEGLVAAGRVRTSW